MGVKMISANKENGQVVEFSIDDDEVAALRPTDFKDRSQIILKSGYVMTVEVGYSELVYLLFSKHAV